MLETIKQEWQAKVAILIFLLFTSWWLINQLVLDPQTLRYDGFGDWAELYGLMAVWGGIWGVSISRKWGGIKSVIGKSILMFSLGLFAQEFGQISYALYYDFFGTPGPYPSLGDFGFFGSILFYIYGVLLLAKASGVHVSIKSFQNKIQAVLIPVVMLIIAYVLFLQNYVFDLSNPIKTFLDFGYPFGQIFYISLAIVTYLLSKGLLGGVMKTKVIYILFALFVQFLSDYVFLYQSNNGLYTVGGVNDYMYLLSYFLMTMAILQLNTVFSKLKN